MTTMASQITSLTVVYSTVYLDADQRKHQSSASLAFVWGIHRDRWIPRTKGQLRGNCFHLMTSSCIERWLADVRIHNVCIVIPRVSNVKQFCSCEAWQWQFFGLCMFCKQKYNELVTYFNPFANPATHYDVIMMGLFICVIRRDTWIFFTWFIISSSVACVAHLSHRIF